MRDSEVRGLILEALYNQRRKDLVNLDDEVGGPPLPHGATERFLQERRIELRCFCSHTPVMRS
jgi:hypothetical protein